MTEERAVLIKVRAELRRLDLLMREFEEMRGSIYPSMERAAMRRASLDLTRALARLRSVQADVTYPSER